VEQWFTTSYYPQRELIWETPHSISSAAWVYLTFSTAAISRYSAVLSPFYIQLDIE
jgi:hypothetical protein